MKRKIAKWTNALRVLMAFMLVLSFSFADFSSVKANGSAAASQIVARGSLKEADLDTGSLRQQYFNQSAISENQTVSYEGKRWVIVELEGDSIYDSYEKSAVSDSFQDYVNGATGEKIKSSLEKSHERFLATLNAKGVDYKFKHSYTVLNNGVAIKISADDYEKVESISGVKSVYFSEKYAVPEVAVTNNANVYSTGIYDSSDLDYKGEGMVVAILDTGLDYAHEAFQTMPDNPAWTKTTVANKLNAIKESGKPFYAKASVDEVYYNEKVPFAYDYADDDPDVYPSYSSHGTHVAGIVAGKSDYVVATKDGVEETFLGVAPQAQLVIGKVFTDNLDSDSLGGADTIDIISAVSDCVALGVDVINMSLGSSAGFAREEDDEFLNSIYDSVEAAGISLVVAASNDYSSGFGGGNGTNLASNPDSGTVGSPSTYNAALSVASINGQKSTYIQANEDEDQVAFITEASDGDGNELDFVDQLYKIAGKRKGETLNFKYVVVGGVGRISSYSGRVARELADKGEYDGTIALIKRGDITFAEKVQNAMDNDADACIIYNNVSGTIRMSLGDVNEPIPTCAIPMDAAKVIVDSANRSVGSIQINSEFKAGPFMSDFSSWGPMPDLQLKPEISAHGGEITSAVPGGYDIYSGTSMAAPNMAGAISLLRQYLKTANPELTGTALNARVNQVLMSTATIALNEEGNPYSPRKQGAGLAGIADAINTESYITVKDENGAVRDKTKIELYDDKTRTGVYEFEFTVNNITDRAQTYDPYVYVMTETLATDKKTVAEKAYMLSDSKIEYTVNGAAHSGILTVPANDNLTVRVKITLSASAKNYIDASFENGMYVEGYVSLKGVNETKITVGLPYLAFYGDWNDAPLFDYSSYEIAESQKDTGIPEEDKLVASAADTKVIGMYYDDKYILAMGAYLYEMADSDVKIYPEKDKIAVSIFDEENTRTIYELYMVYAGLLRGALYMDVEIKEVDSGNVIYSERQYNVSKSYAAGGSNRSAPIVLEIKPDEWNLENNKQYYVSLKGALAYEGGENPERNTFDFTFTVDYEAPQVLDYRVRFDPYTENKQTKYRIYMDVDVYDNQYVQDVMPCYIKSNPDSGKNVLTLVTEHPIPVYGTKGTKSTVSFDITDIYEDYVKTGKLYLAVEDYAMNQSTYNVRLDAAIEYPDTVTVSSDKETFVNTEEKGTNADETEYPIYQVVLSPNELFVPTVTTTPDALIAQSLAWTIESGTEFVRAKGGEFYALKNGKATAVLKDVASGNNTIYAKLEIAVSGEARNKPIADKIVIDPLLNGKGYAVNVSEGTSNTLDMNPNQTAKLIASVSPWYIDGVTFTFKSQNEAVAKVDSVTGEITALKKGTTSIEIIASGENVRLPSKWVKVVVGDYYRIVNYTLYDYYGGPICEIPKDKNVIYIDDECFQYNTSLKKVILPSTVTEIPENAFKGCTNLEEVVIPSQCTVIKESAFAGCRSLKKVTLGVFVDKDNIEHPDYSGALTIGKNVFNGCRSLATIENSVRITTALDGAFEKCTSLESIDISGLRVTGKGVFKGCTKLSEVITSGFTNIGKEMFLNCTSLVGFVYKGTYLSDGAFNGCSSLASFKFSPEGEFLGIGENALAGTSITNIVLPDGEYAISENAFSGCKKLISVVLGTKTILKEGKGSPFTGCDSFVNYVADGNASYSVADGVLYSKDGKTLVAAPTAKTGITILSTVKNIASGALAGTKLTGTLDLGGIETIGEYALAGSTVSSVKLGAITEVPAGLFRSCRQLVSVEGLENVTKVGEYAFMYSAITSIALPNAALIGDYAFKDCKKLTAVTAGEVNKIGKYAFEGSAVKSVDFACATIVGERAFANTSSLVSASLGGVTEMGEYLFASSAVKNVTFGAGTTLVSDYAFYNLGNLENVTLPNGVETIGAFAFSGDRKLSAINLNGTKTVGEYAFLNATSLKNVDLSTVAKFGNGAMSYTAIAKADLANAEYVGDFAFMDNENLTEVTFGALKFVGKYAFSDTRLVTVSLPESFDNINSVYIWEKIDEKGRVEKVRSRNVSAFGEGAFANIQTLTSIEASGSVIFSADGVLYAKEENGLVLLQYPVAKALDGYVVSDGTVAIAASAFEGVNSLGSITFPYTLKTIGSYAFYKSSVENYTFNSVEAPVLLAEFVDVSSVSGNDIEKLIFGRGSTNYLGSTIFYANFHDYVAKLIYKDAFTNYNPSEFGLKAIVPKNGTGYDTNIWTNFFTIERTSDIMPDSTTNDAAAAVDAIEKVMTVDGIKGASSIKELEAVSNAISAARTAYNKITDKEQLVLDVAKTTESKLLVFEAALRDKKAALGSPVAVKELTIAAYPKTRYNAGDKFDATGMVVKLIFDDNSAIIVTDYIVSKTVLSIEDDGKGVTITCNYEGKSYSVDLPLNVTKGTDPVGPVTPETPSKDCNSAITGSDMVIAAIVIAAAILIVVLKKKKA